MSPTENMNERTGSQPYENPLLPSGTPRTDFSVEVWRVHSSDGAEDGVYEDEQAAREAARAALSNRQNAAVRVFVTKTIYQSVAFHKRGVKP